MRLTLASMSLASLPLYSTCPLVALMMPAMTCSIDVFPWPGGARISVDVPAGKVTETSCRR